MAILTRQDADSAEEEAEEEGWSQSSWSTCSGDDATSKGAEKPAPGGLSAHLTAAESDRCHRLVYENKRRMVLVGGRPLLVEVL